MKLNWICGLLFAVPVTVPAPAQISVYVGGAPPPLRYEERGPEPGPGYSWIDGYWTPNGRHYRWVAGRWDRAPYEGAYWNHPHYDHYQQGWQMHEGHWDRENHDNHGGNQGRDDHRGNGDHRNDDHRNDDHRNDDHHDH